MLSPALKFYAWHWDFPQYESRLRVMGLACSVAIAFKRADMLELVPKG